jgi:hypothetical protein
LAFTDLGFEPMPAKAGAGHGQANTTPRSTSMRRGLVAFCAILTLAAAGAPAVRAADIPETWDHLVKVKSKTMKAVYLLPGADFKPYTKVMLDEPEAAFRKNWLRDYNRSAGRSLARQLTDKDAEKALAEVSTSLKAIFTKAFTEGGYQVVTAPGADVIRIRTAVIDLHVNAPDVMTAGRSRSYAPEAGSASLVLEAKDSETGAVLGRAVDGKLAGDMGSMMMRRSSVSNRADFEAIFKTWAKASVKGLNTLKATAAPAEPPVPKSA